MIPSYLGDAAHALLEWGVDHFGLVFALIVLWWAWVVWSTSNDLLGP